MEFRDFSLLVQHTKVRGFTDGLERGELLASRCTTCGATSYPPRSDCPRCLGSEFEWVPITGKGRLLTHTAVFVTPRHFTPDLSQVAPFSSYAYRPAAVGIVEMANGLRVMGWIRGLAIEEIRIGMELEPRPEILPDGRATVTLYSGER
ncbi:MAG: Zn-ribbon domain-containing OB-fold protein [Candidatus Bipolaricaulis sp.]|uniref:Nucleic-acid-binding protein containing a Zn-ribbon n=1 Tax=Candidatus Bipolaricaulis anaerobius TaxID=2026885 RepID=A0A2X3L1Q7_9BACT|nr:Zn-ribbon domain-containing OB-fold protein [Candidatus Bipolaricaulis sp.]SQD93099.1 Putative nucleic-acid-binding protein containing a Zn-ribbon [Candidatus Bipolaricaulis anaerobius]